MLARPEHRVRRGRREMSDRRALKAIRVTPDRRDRKERSGHKGQRVRMVP